jgi:hypothetical protein
MHKIKNILLAVVVESVVVVVVVVVAQVTDSPMDFEIELKRSNTKVVAFD